MKCEDCGEQLVRMGSEMICPNCDPGVFEEKDMNKTMQEEPERMVK